MNLQTALANPPQFWTPTVIGLTIVGVLLLVTAFLVSAALPGDKSGRAGVLGTVAFIVAVSLAFAGVLAHRIAWERHVSLAVAQHVKDTWGLVALEHVSILTNDRARFDAATPDGTVVSVKVKWIDTDRGPVLPGTDLPDNLDPVTVTVEGRMLLPGDDVDEVVTEINLAPASPGTPRSDTDR